MLDLSKRHKGPRWGAIQKALKFSMLDHLRIRACVEAEKHQKSRLRGLVRPPSRSKPYDEADLAKWAKKLIDKRYAKISRLKLKYFNTFMGQLYALLVRGLEYVGEHGVTLIFILIGTVMGLAFLHTRIFINAKVSLSQILIPVLLGMGFILGQIIKIYLCITKRINAKTRDSTKSGIESNQEDSNIFLTSLTSNGRRFLPSYLRWAWNLGCVALWFVVVATMGFEYIRHHEVNRDYVYRSEYMPMHLRIKGLRGFQAFMPKIFHLKNESLVWADRDYRKMGYILDEQYSANRLILNDNSIYYLEEDEIIFSLAKDEQTMGFLCFHEEVQVDVDPPYLFKIPVSFLADEKPKFWKLAGSKDPKTLSLEVKDDSVRVWMKKNWVDSLNYRIENATMEFPRDGILLPFSKIPKKLQVIDAQGKVISELSFSQLELGLKIKRIDKPSGYSNDWFKFLFGVVLIFGLMPRLVATPIFAFLHFKLKYRLFRELECEPYSTILDELNQTSKISVEQEGRTFFGGAGTIETHSKPVALPARNMSAFGYGIDLTKSEVENVSLDSNFDVYPEKAGDVITYDKIMNWLNLHESVETVLVVTKSTITPDRPFLSFMTRLTKYFPCKIAFADIGSGPDEAMNVRLEVWRRVFENNGLLDKVVIEDEVLNDEKESDL